MYFYKQIENDIVVGLVSSEHKCPETLLVEISSEEYEKELSVIMQSAENEEPTDENVTEQSKDERIAELEKENAALLFQLLTGEEYTDV